MVRLQATNQIILEKGVIMLYDPKSPQMFLRSKDGDFAQFALILVLVVIVSITVLQALGLDIVNAFQSVVDAM